MARCSFCRKRSSSIRHLITGEDHWISICDRCVETCTDILQRAHDEDEMARRNITVLDNAQNRCSFCSRPVNTIAYMIASPIAPDRAFICNPCVEACVPIVSAAGHPRTFLDYLLRFTHLRTPQLHSIEQP